MLFQIIELYYTLYNIVRTVFPNPSRALWTKELIDSHQIKNFELNVFKIHPSKVFSFFQHHKRWLGLC